jgi:RNA polymerase sigma factor (sigma-70 family)
MITRRDTKTERAVDARFVEDQYERHGRTVFRICLRLGGGNAAWAEDVTQEVFVRLMEKRNLIDPERNLGSWLCTVAYRLCLDRLKHERRVWTRVKAALSAEPAPISETPEKAVLLSARSAEVMALLQSLAPKERTVLTMHCLEEMSQKDIAQALGLSEGYVSKLLDRAERDIRSAGWEMSHG